MTDRLWPEVGPDHHVGSGVGADMGNFRKVLKWSHMPYSRFSWVSAEGGEGFWDAGYVSQVVALVGFLGEKDLCRSGGVGYCVGHWERGEVKERLLGDHR